MRWFTSDTHFGHQKIIELCKRPFKSAVGMDRAIIKRFNNLIHPNDDVYFLGDFAYHNKLGIAYYLDKLNGRWHFVKGNHDPTNQLNKVKDHPKIIGIWDYREININGKKLVLSHYPIYSWNGKHSGGFGNGAIHLYGHTHNRVDFNPMAFDVGVDGHDFKPWSYDEVLDHIKKRVDKFNKTKKQKITNDEDVVHQIHDDFSDLHAKAVESVVADMARPLLDDLKTQLMKRLKLEAQDE